MSAAIINDDTMRDTDTSDIAASDGSISNGTAQATTKESATESAGTGIGITDGSAIANDRSTEADIDLDALVGITTNTAILPEPDAHAYDAIETGDGDPLILGGHRFTSRFILGSGRYDLNLIKATIENAGTQIVTMALRRCRTTENNLLDYIPKGITMLPNTSGARNAEEAVRIARLAREVCHTDFVKIEIEHEQRYLLPDNAETIKATAILASEGFVAMPYMFPDPIVARQLEDAGAACVMPLGSLIGSNKGIRMRDFIEVIIANAGVPVIIDAGIGRPSQACEAMEMGADAVMAYTAIASAGNIPLMARAFKHAIEAGRASYRSGLGTVTEGHAVPSSPTNASDYLG
ncbi:MAG: thiazole synthase [Bifidobacterium subtile]|nr:thiazole synthase [Bifidobacterium subtile]MCI1241542.1 thiazole synthase [Bifidobacterium subtile]MCI1258767.1 thiazole synthase [Bifidobacterium subtile]